jgi:hypothetical protein
MFAGTQAAAAGEGGHAPLKRGLSGQANSSIGRRSGEPHCPSGIEVRGVRPYCLRAAQKEAPLVASVGGQFHRAGLPSLAKRNGPRRVARAARRSACRYCRTCQYNHARECLAKTVSGARFGDRLPAPAQCSASGSSEFPGRIERASPEVCHNRSDPRASSAPTMPPVSIFLLAICRF